MKNDTSYSGELEKIIRKYGPWTAHNVEIKTGVFTIGEGEGRQLINRAQTFERLIHLFSNKRLKKSRVLDLGCLEGGISLYLAKAGASCTGVDIRKANIAKAAFASRLMNLSKKCTWKEADVIDNRLWESIGKFDIVICSGLLYHLDYYDIVPFIKNMKKCLASDGMIIFDTNITCDGQESRQVENNLNLRGRVWREHNDNATLAERTAAVWSSMNNNTAFWLTERSLINAIVASGLHNVFKPLYPYHEWGHVCRDIWIAKHGISDKEPKLRNDPDPRPIEHPGLK